MQFPLSVDNHQTHMYDIYFKSQVFFSLSDHSFESDLLHMTPVSLCLIYTPYGSFLCHSRLISVSSSTEHDHEKSTEKGKNERM